MVNEMETQVLDLSYKQSKFQLFSLNLFFFLGCLVNGTTVDAHPILFGIENHRSDQEGIRISPRFDYYTTNKNFDLNSALVPPAGNGSVTRTYFSITAEYSFTSDWYAFARLTWLGTKVESTFINGTAYGLGDQTIGLGYAAWKNEQGSALIIQAEGTIPAYNNTQAKTDATPFLGDGSYDVSLGSFFDYALPFASAKNLKIQAGAAFASRSNGYSSSIPWSILLIKKAKKGIFFEAGVRGQTSLQTDSTTALAATSDQNRGSGGSFIVNAVNPSWILGQAKLGFGLSDSTSFFFQLATPFMATNAPSGLQLTAGATFQFDGSDDEFQSAPKTKTVSKSNLNEKFSTYDLDAEVTSVNDQLYIVKINQGSSSGVQKGQIFDIFQTVENSAMDQPTQKMIARSKVSNIKSNEAVLTITEYFVESWIEQGFTARRLVR